MGVDIRLYLYRSADPREVASAMAILAGNDPSPDFIARNPPRGRPEPAYRPGARPAGGFWVPRPKLTLKPVDNFVGMATIEFDSPVDPYNRGHFCHIHTGDYHGFGWILGPPSTPFWIALARRVVDIFGGALDHNDCDSSEADYFRFERSRGEGGDGDDTYLQRQDELLALRPLAPAEIEACRQFAAYDSMGSYYPADGIQVAF